MIRGPSFIVSTMQEETTPIFKRLWYDWTQQQPGIEPTNPLAQCWVPPIVAFYDQQGLLRTYSLPGGSIRSPHPGSPRGYIMARSWGYLTQGFKFSDFSLILDFFFKSSSLIEKVLSKCHHSSRFYMLLWLIPIFERKKEKKTDFRYSLWTWITWSRFGQLVL